MVETTRAESLIAASGTKNATVGEVVDQLGRQLQSQPGLASPSRSGQGQQAHVASGEQLARGRDLAFTANQGRRLHWQVVGTAVQVASGGKSAARPGPASWKTRSGRKRSLSRRSPRSRRYTSSGR